MDEAERHRIERHQKRRPSTEPHIAGKLSGGSLGSCLLFPLKPPWVVLGRLAHDSVALA
jgi:hypothetical protein